MIKLSDNWYVKGEFTLGGSSLEDNTDDLSKAIIKTFSDCGKIGFYNNHYYYYNLEEGKLRHTITRPKNKVEITLEEFKRYILNEEPFKESEDISHIEPLMKLLNNVI